MRVHRLVHSLAYFEKSDVAKISKSSLLKYSFWKLISSMTSDPKECWKFDFYPNQIRTKIKTSIYSPSAKLIRAYTEVFRIFLSVGSILHSWICLMPKDTPHNPHRHCRHLTRIQRGHQKSDRLAHFRCCEVPQLTRQVACRPWL